MLKKQIKLFILMPQDTNINDIESQNKYYINFKSYEVHQKLM